MTDPEQNEKNEGEAVSVPVVEKKERLEGDIFYLHRPSVLLLVKNTSVWLRYHTFMINKWVAMMQKSHELESIELLCR